MLADVMGASDLAVLGEWVLKVVIGLAALYTFARMLREGYSKSVTSIVQTAFDKIAIEMEKINRRIDDHMIHEEAATDHQLEVTDAMQRDIRHLHEMVESRE